MQTKTPVVTTKYVAWSTQSMRYPTEQDIFEGLMTLDRAEENVLEISIEGLQYGMIINGGKNEYTINLNLYKMVRKDTPARAWTELLIVGTWLEFPDNEIFTLEETRKAIHTFVTTGQKDSDFDWIEVTE